MADLKEFQRKMEKTLDVLASDFAAVRFFYSSRR